MNPLLPEDLQRDLILASSSPRRREILENLGFEFEVIPADIDEDFLEGEDFISHVERLALSKAVKVSKSRPEGKIIGADTIVVFEGRVLGKPVDESEAEEMLRLLSGKKHQVITALALVAPSGSRIVKSETTDVVFYELSREEIRRYVATGEPMDKAGAYAIQGYASAFVRRIEGCFFNVVGLPVWLLFSMLKEMGESVGS